MKVRDHSTLEVTPETKRTYEVMKMHLFDIYASEEKALHFHRRPDGRGLLFGAAE